ncbi:39254_t:CDS:2 [Gigaspora margarita]|uniref:39254_t:CDS:1 n=1 Tax=Gigaspora margarita TaxID=4874 RepID=A0ABM8VXH4_GIGMA|nr:39254_t:CDS:2 [Gigaspora margarita]
MEYLGETTNAAEFAHADINCEEKGLNLMNAVKKLIYNIILFIIRAQKFDNRKFMTCAIQDRCKSISNESNEEGSLTQIERQISLEEEQKLLNYERARELGVEKELGYQ